MDTRFKVIISLVCLAFLALASIQAPVFAKSASVGSDRDSKQRYIVVLDDLPLAAYDGRVIHAPELDAGSTSLPATANTFTGAHKLDVNTPESKQYLQFLDERFESFRGEAMLRLGRQLKPTNRYRNVVNGFATELTASEVKALREMPRVKSVLFDEKQYLQTDSGPNWIGANIIHDGEAGFPATAS